MTRLPSNLVIGLAGDRGVGKDTLFNLLRAADHRFTRWAYADALKGDLRLFLVDQFGIDPLTATGAEKELIRPILIAYGCAWRERYVDHWAERVADDIGETIRSNPQPLIHVITDCRFENEVRLARQRFGEAFRLIRVDRIGSPGPTDEERKHSAAVSAMADYHILWGDDTEAQRAEIAVKLIQWLENSVESSHKPQI